MKPEQYRRYQRRRSIKRKETIIKNVYGGESGHGYLSVTGKLDKGKIHCSCPLCAAKSKRDRGVRNHSVHNYKISDQRKMAKLLTQLEESYVEEA